MTILNRDQTWDLWQQGKTAWNTAIRSGDITEVTFSGDLYSNKCQFNDCYFPDKAYFHNVRFISAENEPSISFENADFKKVEFLDLKCIGVSLSFENATFNVSADFCDSNLQNISFKDARFYRFTHFSNTKFQGKSNFHRIKVEGYMHFNSVEFEGLADFTQAVFSENISISSAKFSDIARFVGTKFGRSSFFLYTKFNGNAYFNNISASEAERFSFKGASFDKIFVISSEKEIGCVMDFVDTYAKYSLNLGDIYCTFRREHKDLPNHKWLSKILKLLPAGFKTPKHPDDISRLRKLKKVAQEEKDHLRALDYKVQEMQAKRWHDNVDEPTGRLSKLFKAIPECVFWLLSDYGRGLFRPALWLLFITFIMVPVYYSLLSADTSTDQSQNLEDCSSEQLDYYDALGYSFSQIFPWTPISRVQQESFRKKINCSPSKTSITFLSLAHTIVSTLLLFLFGLGARNRFLL